LSRHNNFQTRLIVDVPSKAGEFWNDNEDLGK